MSVTMTEWPRPRLYSIPGGVRIAARTNGCGPAVLLLHGVGTASASYWAQLETLGDTYRLIAWDAFGYGRSDDPPAPARLDDYADAAAALLDAHGRGDAHVVGVSWGGLVATRLALRHPDRVRTLALISSTFGRKANQAVRAGFGERITALERDGVRAWTQARVGTLVSADASPELRSRIVETAVESVRLAGFTGATTTLADTDHRPVLGEVRASTIVLCGDQDRVTGLPESRVLAEGIPGAELVVVPGGGHLLNQEKPDTVNAELRRHWRRHDGRRGEIA